MERTLDIKSVAVIGAGISGVAAAVHLKRAGLDVTVFERNAKVGGVWVYDERVSKDPAYPSSLPSAGDSPEFEEISHHDGKRHVREDSPLRQSKAIRRSVDDDLALSFAPPGYVKFGKGYKLKLKKIDNSPCYIALQNNVSTIEMQLSCQTWKPNTAEFVPHHVIADYIQDVAANNDALSAIRFNTRINHVEKQGGKWKLDVAELVQRSNGAVLVDRTELFDSVVVASGHYHACNVPDIPGLSTWKHHFPDQIQHSKRYRTPEGFQNQNVLLIGSGTSSTDIARDLGEHARAVYQSSRGGPYDWPSHLLPVNSSRIGAIASFDALPSTDLAADGTLPGTVTLASGQVLCNIHRVVVCTGYHVSFPFMREYHADEVRVEDASDSVLVTSGQQTHNLHKDIWYIPDPTLAFIGIPYHVATFSLYEFQAMALAAVFAGRAPLPIVESMREEYKDRIREKGAGRHFHSLRKRGGEIAYVQDLVNLANKTVKSEDDVMEGHTEIWLEAYARRGVRGEAIFAQTRDPAVEHQAQQLIYSC